MCVVLCVSNGARLNHNIMLQIAKTCSLTKLHGSTGISRNDVLLPTLCSLWNNSITDASVPHLVGLMETARKLEKLR